MSNSSNTSRRKKKRSSKDEDEGAEPGFLEKYKFLIIAGGALLVLGAPLFGAPTPWSLLQGETAAAAEGLLQDGTNFCFEF